MSTINQWLWLFYLGIFLIISACQPMAYYGQAISGQMEMTLKREKIDKLLQQGSLGEEKRKKLKQIDNLLAFAEKEMQLKNHGSYRHYVDLDREYVVWNVFAAPALSMQPVTWCYPVAGCLAYRGYFKENAAIVYSKKLSVRGLDTYVAGVTAYSTLGWFNDPVTSVMINQHEAGFANTIFHELAHQKIFIGGETSFNESFATAVALIAMEKYYGISDKKENQRGYEVRESFIKLILLLKDKLNKLYESEASDEEKLERKSSLLSVFRTDYKKWKLENNTHDDFDQWVFGPLNNAKLLTIATYNQWVPVFLSIYESCDKKLTCFYQQVSQMKKLKQQERQEFFELEIANNKVSS